MICPECNSKFKLRNRIKSMVRKYGKIECSKCKSIFREERNLGIVNTSISMGLIVLLCNSINLLIGGLLKNKFVAISIAIFAALIVVPPVMFLAQSWTNYKKIEE